MTLPLVSVIVPTYNGSKRIEKTLRSIIAQDYENLEIIVVDDVSTDNTVEIVQSVLEDSGRKFQLIKRTVNGRQSASRNTGIKAANGKYIIFFDHDDLAEKNFVSSLCKEAEEKNADLVLCGYKHYYEDEDRYDAVYLSFKNNLSSPEDYLLAWTKHTMSSTLCTIWNCIFNRAFLEKNQIRFSKDCYIGEDLEFILKAVASSSRMSSINDLLYIQVMHETQQTRAYSKNFTDYKNVEQEILCRFRAARRILRHIKNKHVRNFIFTYCIAHKKIQQLTKSAQAGDREYYNLKVKHLKHKKIRKIFLGTVKFFIKDPELFFKSLMILYAPALYFKMRQQ